MFRNKKNKNSKESFSEFKQNIINLKSILNHEMSTNRFFINYVYINKKHDYVYYNYVGEFVVLYNTDNQPMAKVSTTCGLLLFLNDLKSGELA